MWSEPVMFGGGMTMEKTRACGSRFASGAKQPCFSQRA
jgi:hypothetical protein